MPLHVVACRPARAVAALRDAVRAAKAGAALAPVTVVVPTNTAGVMARRALGAGGGVAAVDTITLFRLAEVLAAPSLTAEGRMPVSNPVVDLTVRRVLAEDPGAFEPVADHPSTVVALRDLHRELRAAGSTSPNALAAASARGREAALVSSRTTAALGAAWYDEGDLLARATEVVATTDRLRPVVVHLPQRLGLAEAALVRALAARVDVTVVVEVTGDAHADAPAVALVRSLVPAWRPPAIAAPDQPAGRVEVESSTDADDEVRHAVRHVLDAARSGTPLARIAVLWPSERPYARLVHHHLDAAGVAWNGRPGTQRTERLVPRLVLDLLAVDRRGLRRRDLFELLADVPARHGDRRLPTASWERVSRAAGVARDDHWSPRLAAYAAGRRAGSDDGTSRDADAADDLRTFVDRLRRTLGHAGAARPWAGWAAWCEERIDEWLGRRQLARLDEAELTAWDDTVRALERLRHLDRIGPPVTRHEFRTTLLAELEVAPARQGRVGVGVTVGSLAGAAGLDVDVAIVLGAADGELPPAPRPDPLVGDEERRAAGLDTSDVHAARLHRQFLALVDRARHVVVTYPRGDLRAASHREPSRWIGAHLRAAPVRHVHSHVAGLIGTPFPVSASEHRLRTLATAVASGRSLSTVPAAGADAVLQAAMRLRTGRASQRLTEYDGDLSGVAVPALTAPVSPTQLEAWVACPHAYFVRYLLGVKEIEEPGDAVSITPLDRGSVLHDALDAFHRAVLAGELPQPGPNGWEAQHAAALGELFDRIAARTESTGRGGRAASWADERSRMRADLLEWLEHDGRHVAERGARVVSSEWRFGADGDVTIALAGGRRLAVAGSVDRVDETGDGFIVTDHKTGRPDRFSGITELDPTAGGTKLQLVAYAAATLARAGRADAVVEAEFSFFRQGRYQRVRSRFTPEVWTHVGHVLGHVVAGVESGFYPSVPEPPGWSPWVPCAACEPDGLGRTERWAQWQAKRHDPRLARWFADPDAETGDAGHPTGTS